MSNHQDHTLTQFEILEQKTEIPAGYVISTLFFSLMLVFLGYLDMHITNIIGIVFPIYWTVKALELPEKDDDRQWLSYWFIFFGLLGTDLLFGFYLKYIPYYYFVKLSFLIWLFLPNTKGALVLHDKVLCKYLGNIDMEKVNFLLNKVSLNTKEATNHILDSLKEVTEKILEIPERSTLKAEELLGETSVGTINDRPENMQTQQQDIDTKVTEKQKQDVDQFTNEMLNSRLRLENLQQGGPYDIKKHPDLIESDEPRSMENILENSKNPINAQDI